MYVLKYSGKMKKRLKAMSKEKFRFLASGKSH